MTLWIWRLLLPLLGIAGPGLVVMGLPGTWLLLALASLAEWTTDARLFSVYTWVGVCLVALAGEVWETLAASSQAKRAGAGRRGTLGALFGGIAGAIAGTIMIPIPVIGTLVGGMGGAFALAAGLERMGGKPTGDALRIGRSAASGQVRGMLGKLVCGLVVYVWLVVALFV